MPCILCHLTYGFQIISADYGFYTWPSARILAEFIWKSKDYIKGKSILELGSGTSLPGLVAAACGASVVLSDKEDAIDILANARTNWLSNNPVHLYSSDNNFEPIFLNISIIGFTWGNFSPDILKLCPDIIIAADCFYDNSNVFEDAISSIDYFMQKNLNCRFITTYQERSSQRSIAFLLSKWNMEAKSIDISNLPLDNYNLKNTIHLIEIVKKRG